MKRFRFNIASLLAGIFILGVGFAALREATDLWESGVFSLTLGVLLISILFAYHRHESKRAFWLGFALIGWIYLGLTLVPSIESRLITTKALGYLVDSKVSGRFLGTPTDITSMIGLGAVNNSDPNVAFTADGNQIATVQQAQIRLWDAAMVKLIGRTSGTTVNFVWIGHSLFALLVGWLGGQLSRRLCRTSRLSEPSTVDSEGTNS